MPDYASNDSNSYSPLIVYAHYLKKKQPRHVMSEIAAFFAKIAPFQAFWPLKWGFRGL